MFNNKIDDFLTLYHTMSISDLGFRVSEAVFANCDTTGYGIIGSKILWN